MNTNADVKDRLQRRTTRAYYTGVTLAGWGWVLSSFATVADFVFTNVWIVTSDLVMMLGCLATYFLSREKLVWQPFYFSYWFSVLVTLSWTGGILSPVAGLSFAVLFIAGISVQLTYHYSVVFLWTFANVLLWALVDLVHPLAHLASGLPVGYSLSINSLSLTTIGVCIYGYARAEKILEKEFSKEGAANAAKSTFLASVSHELRTPLGAITGFAELIQDPASSENERLGYAEIIRRNGEQLTKLVNDLLDLSKIEAGRIEIESLDYSPGDVAADVVNLMRFKAEAKGLMLVCSIADEVPETVIGDPTRFKQILLNLVGNSVKFSDRGQVGIELFFEATDEPGEGRLIAEVHDTGPGVAEAVRVKLFEPYMQADASTARVFGGTGLGLNLSRKLAEIMGGSLELVSSKPGQGSLFRFHIRVGEKPRGVAKISMRSPSIWKPGPDLSFDGRRILIVDDSEDNLRLICKYLEGSAAIVSVAVSGEQAIQMASQAEFDLILMDLQMPGMDGIEVTRTLRERKFRKPILALTAHARSEDRNRCLSAGCSDFMTKPISRRDLFHKLDLFFRPRSVATVSAADGHRDDALEGDFQ